MDSLGDRMKCFENANRTYLTRKVPVLCRCDGQAFHTYTRGLDKPFDQDLIDMMATAALNTAMSMHGCEAAYVQSDEVTFLLCDFQDIKTEPFFDYNVQKLVSTSAALMTAHFIREVMLSRGTKFSSKTPTPTFDSRVFNIPKEDTLNAILWRMKDWERNSLFMYAAAFFSHKELMHKNKEAKHEMLHEIGKNWTTDLPAQQRNGTFFVKLRTEDGCGWEKRCDILPNYTSISEAFKELPNPCLNCLE